MLTPSLEQVKQLAKQYNTIPVFYGQHRTIAKRSKI